MTSESGATLAQKTGLILALWFLSASLAWSETLIHPGEVWLDTAGNPINAHGGGMMYYRGTYYWYGEDKQGSSHMPEVNKSWDGYRVEVTGVHCYSSPDLLNWRDEGLVLRAETNNPTSDLHPSKVVERPKVAYNARTRQFVMWLHIDSADYSAARAGVAVADNPTGPFRYRGSVKPEGGDSRDQTLFVDDDGKAYRIYSSETNMTTYISELSENWLLHSGRYARVFPGAHLEAPIVFKRQGQYYFLASGCTGWDPNPAHLAVAPTIWGPWREIGNPCVGPEAETTFRSQGTYAFPVVGKKDAFIFMADRWIKKNLPDSRYIWLPIVFTGEGLTLDWQSNWSLSQFGPNPRYPALRGGD